jgi:hypothetical protein
MSWMDKSFNQGPQGPQGPPGPLGPGSGTDVAAASFPVPNGTSFMRIDTTASDVVCSLPAVGLRDGEPHGFLIWKGTNYMIITSGTANILDPGGQGLVSQFKQTGVGFGVTFSWMQSQSIWVPSPA